MEDEMKEQKERKVAEEYLSSLADLNVNSKPLINMLTILAEENIEHAAVIVKVVEQHIAKVHPDIKLPILYLIDSIVKNVKSTYIQLFSQCIVNIFCGVFEQVSEKVRERMYILRQTWNEVFTAQKLYTLDVKVNCMDRNWPITAKVTKSPSIHVNPNFLKKNEMEATLRVKTRELLELEKRKLELELEATKKLLQEQEKQLSKQTESVKAGPEHPQQVRHQTMPPMQGAPVHHVPPRGMNVFHNYRNAGPRQPPPNMMNMNMPQGYPPGVTPQSLHQQKPKVHPVNPLLLNTIRHRDPRLARQQQQQQQQQSQPPAQEKPVPSQLDVKAKFTPPPPGGGVTIPQVIAQPQPVTANQSNNNNQGSASSYRNSKSFDSRSTKRRENNDRSNHDRSSRDRAITHDRSSKSRSEEEQSDGGSGGRAKSSSASSRSKRGGSRSRSESKSPTRARSSSARSSNRSGSSSRDKDRRGISNNKSNSDRRKGSSNSRSSDTKYSSSCPKIEEEPENTSEAIKKKSNSPASSPNKYKDSKSKSVSSGKSSRSYSGRKHKSRSPSPTASKDVDLRIIHPDKRPRLAPLPSIKMESAVAEDRNSIMPPPPPSMDAILQKLEPEEKVLPAKATIDFSVPEHEQLTTNVTAKSLDQKIPTASNGNNNSTNASNRNDANQLDVKVTDSIKIELKIEDNRKEENAVLNGKPIGDKKRSSTEEDAGEPTAKRSKSGKMDGLFGTEDVDLRTVIPTVILNQNTGIMTPPPPPVISSEKENWAKVKGSSPATKISPSKSSLDDVRAKLAKAAKFNKMEKTHKELSQKFKIAELQDESASQECNDTKIRTIISQAQELLEARSINEDQYHNLVKTVMQINETNKLNAAKRLESLSSSEQTADAPPVDPERMAREAVHKKRIPKLSKEQQQAAAAASLENNDAKDSPILVDDSSQENADSAPPSKQQSSGSGEKEKRVKVSKWSAPSQPVNSNLPSSQTQPQRQRFGASSAHGGNRPPFNNRMAIPSPWQNPSSVFNGTAQPRPHAPPAAISGPPQPPAILIPKPCNSIDNPQADVVRTITIDGRTKEIRFYGDVAIVFMDWDQPREIGFQPGTRTITIDNKETIVLNFNEDYKEVSIDGEPHRMRFAFPSRELYIDENWYEVYFGGPAMPIPINSKMHLLQAEGPPPQVHIGILRRDLVVGKINMIVDARNIIPIFLDADPQTFTLDGKQHVLEFADNLKTVVINNEPMHVEYGGLPKSMILGGRKYFVRFGALPSGIVPGQHGIKGMKYLKMQPPAIEAVPAVGPVVPLPSEAQNPALQPVEPDTGAAALPPVVSPPLPAISATTSVIPGIAPILPNVNIDELFQKLISSGIINTITNTSGGTDSKTPKSISEPKSPKELEPIKPVDLLVPETVKSRQAAIIDTLFSGMQCSSCGVRFPPEQTIKYSQHLDWHFRQNRRERDSSRKAHSRKWYYEISDWLQYEEVEDLEDREKNFFESQQVDLDSIDESSNQRASNSPIPSCPAEPGDVDRACDMCQEKFEQFYNEDLEEWHLRAAIRVEDKIYHPLCYEDYKASLNPPEPETETKVEEPTHLAEITIEDDNAVDVAFIKTENVDDAKPETKDIPDDEDDDDVIVVPTEEPSITEIEDDEEYIPVNMSREEMGGVADDNTVVPVNETMESDVEIQEPNIPFTDLDTYVEKPSVTDETSQSSLLNIKIKEEPKDDDEEDDGFEDVGIVLIPEEEISIQSSDENTATRTISSTVSSPTPSPIVADASADLSQPPILQTAEATAPTIAIELPEATNSMDGNLEPNDNPISTNTALVGVNKIKINMTKNIVTSNNSTSTTTTTKSNSLNQNELKSTTSGGSVSNISTIPVLCSGATTISTITGLPPVALGGVGGGGGNGSSGSLFSGHSAFSTIPSLCNPALSAANGNTATVASSNNTNVIQVITSHTTTGPANMEAFPSSIPVIGSSSSTSSSSISGSSSTKERATPPLPSSALTTKSPMVAAEEEEPTYTLKQELQNVQLKKVKKIECGLEASGLCSIM